MTFTNLQVPLESLPAIDDLKLDEIEPVYAWLVTGLSLIFLMIVALGATIGWLLSGQSGAAVPIGIAAPAAIAIALLYLLYRFKAARAIRFAVREHDLIRSSGLFWQNEVLQPLQRVQHIELHRGPLERRLGLATISLFSAGSGRATFAIPGLRLATAARMRRHVLDRAQRQS